MMIAHALKSLLLDLWLPWAGVAAVLFGLCLLTTTGFAGFFGIAGLWLFAWFWLLMGMALRSSPAKAGPGIHCASTSGVFS
ncbi:MAG: hypothetical protein E6Q88_07120 [Lysobacteraceae bacterium]|nr:MAG: hypothetical protein E6Q88_07120 [Xanthomonadaceae bacterium]